MPAIEIQTARLQLRQWQESDREPFAALSSDPEVMRFFPAIQLRESSNRSVDTWSAEIDQRGWSNSAVEIRATRTFIGFIGLSLPKRALPFTPCVEIGYRLAKCFWHQGYATEGAAAALRFGFAELSLEEIVSFTALVNLPSRAVMQRIGLINANQDFDHPAVPEGNALRRHCLYKISRALRAQNVAS